MNLAMCEVPVHPVQFLSVAELEALPELSMTPDTDWTYYCDGESTQDGTPSPDNPVPIINTYSAGTYKAICGDKTYKVVLDDDLRSVPGVADRVRIDAGRGVCCVERNVMHYTIDGSEFFRNTYYPNITSFDILKNGGNINFGLVTNYCKKTYFGYANIKAKSIQFGKCDTYWNFADADECKAWLKEKYDSGNPMYFYYALAEPTTHQSVPTQLATITSGRSVTIQNTVNDAVDMLTVKGDSWQLVQEQGKNLVNPDELEIGGLSGIAGEIFTTSTRIRIGFIPVEKGKKYVFSGYNYIFANTHVYDSSKSRIGNFYNGKEIVSGGKYVRVSFKKSTDEDFTEEELQELKSTLMFEEGDTATDYEPFNPAMPSPEYPSEIVSVEGEMESCVWNLFYIPDIDVNTIERSIECEISKPITVSMINDNVELYKEIWRLRFSYKGGTSLYLTDGDTKQPKTFFASEENPIMKITLRSTYILSGKYRNIQIEYGTTQRPYDRFRGNSITLPVLRSLPDSTHDTLYVDRRNKRAWVERCVGVAEFDGSEDENWKVDQNNGFSISVSDMKNGKLLGGYCNRFQSNKGFLMQCIIFGYNNSNLFFSNTFDIADTLETWKVWLSSNPLTVHYVLATPTIEELPYSEYLLETAQYETNIHIDCNEHLEPEIEVECKVLGR